MTLIFGRRGDACLLGVVTLEALGLRLDLLGRRLRPLRLMIVSIEPPSAGPGRVC